MALTYSFQKQKDYISSEDKIVEELNKLNQNLASANYPQSRNSIPRKIR